MSKKAPSNKQSPKVVITHDPFFEIVREVFDFLIKDFQYQYSGASSFSYVRSVSYERANEGVCIYAEDGDHFDVTIYGRFKTTALFDHPSGEKELSRSISELMPKDLVFDGNLRNVDRSSITSYKADLKRRLQASADLLRRFGHEYLTGQRHIDPEEFKKAHDKHVEDELQRARDMFDN